MAQRINISADYLRECFTVDESTGHLFWRARPRCHFLRAERHADFNAHFVGKRADIGIFPCNGYGRVRLRYMGKQMTLSAHRVVFALVHGRWPDDEVDHIDGCRTNNRPSNLRELTHRENMAAAWARRRSLGLVRSARA